MVKILFLVYEQEDLPPPEGQGPENDDEPGE